MQSARLTLPGMQNWHVEARDADRHGLPFLVREDHRMQSKGASGVRHGGAGTKDRKRSGP